MKHETSGLQWLKRRLADAASSDPWKVHYATENSLLTPEAIQAAKDAFWTTTRETNPTLGRLARSILKGAEKTPPKEKKPVVGLYRAGDYSRLTLSRQLHPRLKEKLDTYIEKQQLKCEFFFGSLQHARLC